ncbi:C40 family peptidase [Nannocystis pusilla]|uniref:C40 family peptidase n=1 Tax=Nannocystis pusilla TaxID=889268 RepID=A0ABS7U4R6_9BACT|nr:NlpC/P60 family protein [Nannocystis pusilla]MBZ5715322.1 C40 family peptidase [Nannocystis pusilla]
MTLEAQVGARPDWRVTVMTLEARVQRALAERRRALQRRFGWAGPGLRCGVEPRRRALVVSGEALSRRALAAALAQLQAELPDGWSVDAAGTQIAAPQRWFALAPGVTRLWRAPPRLDMVGGACRSEHAREGMADRAWDFGHVREGSELCTELLPGDGPVGVLAAVGDSVLVRARDGTLGWTRARLGPTTAAQAPTRCSRAAGEAALTRALRRFRGAQYVLGGTTPLGVDCSGLVQRAVRSALGVVLPRHSSDQLALAAAPVRPLGEPGDLLFLWGAGEAACHVGVVLRGARAGARTLIHASSRRGRVIEEPLEQALARTSRWRHMELEQVLASPS